MYTFWYSFKSWLKDELATAEQIRAYLSEVIDENNLGPSIRYRHRVSSASWSSGTRLWTVEVTRLDTGEQLRCSADLVWMCQGVLPPGPGIHVAMAGYGGVQGSDRPLADLARGP